MAARILTLGLAAALCAAPARAEEGPRLDAALEAVAYKALEAQEKPPLIEEASAEWRRLRETSGGRAAFAEGGRLREKSELVERLLTGIMSAQRYAELRDDDGFRKLAEESGARWEEGHEWAPGRRGAFVRAGKPVTLAELRDISLEHERRRAAALREELRRDDLSPSAAESAMERGRARYAALRESDPVAAREMLQGLYDLSSSQLRAANKSHNAEERAAVNRVVQMGQDLRRGPQPPERAAAPARPAPPPEQPSALRAAFCEAFARLELPPGFTASACPYADVDRRLAFDKARATRDLLQMLQMEMPKEPTTREYAALSDSERQVVFTRRDQRARLQRLADQITSALALSGAERDRALRAAQLEADRLIGSPSPERQRSYETLERERVLLDSATVREAVAADLLGRVAELGAKRRPDLVPLIERMALEPESLSEAEWGTLQALFDEAGAGEAQRILRVAMGESQRAREAVSRFYEVRGALSRYRTTTGALYAARMSALLNGSYAGPAEPFRADELGLQRLPESATISPGTVEGKRGLWASYHRRRVFTAADGSFELTVALDEANRETGRARRRRDSRVVELEDKDGHPRGLEFELGGLAGSRDAVRAAAVELAAAMAARTAPGATVPEAEALSSFLERGLHEASGQPPDVAPAAPTLSVSPDGWLELQLWFQDGNVRVHRARFEQATDFSGRPRGGALVGRVPHTIRASETSPPPSAKKAFEYLSDGSIVFWRDTRGAATSHWFSQGTAPTHVYLHRAVRGLSFGEWVDEEREKAPRISLVETFPDSSVWSHFKKQLYQDLTSGTAGRVGVGPVTVGNAMSRAESLLAGLGWAGDKFYHAVVGVGQTDVAMLTGSPLGQLEAEATMARLRGLTLEQAERLVARLPPEQQSLLDERIYTDRQRDLNARGDTMLRVGTKEYQDIVFAKPDDRQRAAALLERFGAGTYGARAVEEAGRRDGAARYALYVGGGAMQFGEDTARSLPQMLALNVLGRLSALRVTGGTTLARGVGTGATVTQVVVGRVMQVSGFIGTADGIANIVDGFSRGDMGKVALNLGSTISDLADFFGSAREMAKSGERRRAAEARQRALAVFAGELRQARADVALSDMTDIRSFNENVHQVRDPQGRGQPLVVKLNATAAEAENLRRASQVRLPPESDNVRIPAWRSQGADGLPGDLRRRAARRGEGQVPLVMESATGASLKDFLSYDGEAPARRWEGPPISARDWEGLRSAIAALNAAGVQHGDLRNPENIRMSVGPDGRVRFELIDWGGPANPAMRLSDDKGLLRLEQRLRQSGLLAADAGGRERANPRETWEYLFGDRAGRRLYLDSLSRRYNPFRRAPAGSNVEFQARAVQRFMQDPTAVVGALDSGLIQLQNFDDCAVHALYNHPALAPVKASMPYERFLELAESAAGSRLREEGTSRADRAAVLEALGYAVVEHGAPHSEADLVARLRHEGSVLGGFNWRSPMAGGRSFHAVVIAGAIRDADGTWKYLVTDSNRRTYQEYTYAQLTDLGLQTRGIVEDTPSGRPLAAADRQRVIAAALATHGAVPRTAASPSPDRGDRTRTERAPADPPVPVHVLRDAAGNARADGRNLTHPGDPDNTSFRVPMARSIDQMRQSARRQLDAGGMSEADVRELMETAGRARRAVALAARRVDPDYDDPGLFGARIPETPGEIDAYNRQMDRVEEKDHPIDSLTHAEATTTDQVMQDSQHPVLRRHNRYFDAATAAMNRRGIFQPVGTQNIGGRNINLSRLFQQRRFDADGTERPVILVSHPNYQDMAALRRHAREIIASAVSERGISEADFMDRLARAYRLLCHATPWVRGSPAAIEATYDALLRAKFGKSLPPKTSEPFWDAILSDHGREYTGRDFLRNYGGDAPPPAASASR